MSDAWEHFLIENEYDRVFLNFSGNYSVDQKYHLEYSCR